VRPHITQAGNPNIFGPNIFEPNKFGTDEFGIIGRARLPRLQQAGSAIRMKIR
jgi:hypothetical protein